ncbi:MAG: tRNA-dihydrouridine synthase family protein [Treponema sp.]|jgi:tRNA-dihydrouridine synthase|nr:tRNA-dihydrouridine synthase family protein [Treponema sp.]
MTSKFMLAPMAEISHRPLRELIENHGGCDEYFTEMISAPGLLSGGPFEAWYIDAGPKPEKTVYQLVGADPDKLAEAAALLDKNECIGIDINMGCSAPAITRTGAGVRWMESIDKAGAMIAKVRQAVSRRLSVKLRIGQKDDFEYLARFCCRLEAEGVELITLHPRTAKEKFRRTCRWDYVPALKKELKIPIAGNGDISSAEEMIRRGKDCDAVMIGRLAVRSPWILAQAKALEAGNDKSPAPNPNIEETGLKFLELLTKYQPPEFHISRARRFFSYFCDNLKWGNYLKVQLNKELDLTGIEKAWLKYFAENEEEEKPGFRI